MIYGRMENFNDEFRRAIPMPKLLKAHYVAEIKVTDPDSQLRVCLVIY